MKKPLVKAVRAVARTNYAGLVSGVGELLEAARHASVRVTNALMTATYWEVGRRIVEFEQGGKKRAEYGEELLDRLSADLTARCGRGFSRFNLARFRSFYLAFPPEKIRATLSLVSTRNPPLAEIARGFPLSWSHYVLLIRGARSPEALDFYHTEALRGGWSVRQLDRQINSLFYERAALSRNKAAMLKKGAKPMPGKVLAREYRLALPNEKRLAREMEKARRAIERNRKTIWQTYSANENVLRSWRQFGRKGTNRPNSSLPQFYALTELKDGGGTNRCLANLILFSGGNIWPFLWTVVSGTAVGGIAESPAETNPTGNTKSCAMLSVTRK